MPLLEGPEGSAAAGVAAWERARVTALLRGDAKDRAEAAASPYLGPESLAGLSRDRSMVVRAVVAERADCPPELLARLAGDKTWPVAADAMSNPACPPEALEEQFPHRPALVLANPACPQGLLLAGLRGGFVAEVTANPAAGPEVLEELYRSGGTGPHKALAHPNCPGALLAEAAQGKIGYVSEVLSHPNLPAEVRAWVVQTYGLAGSEDETGRAPARYTRVRRSELCALAANPSLTTAEARALVAVLDGASQSLPLYALAKNRQAPPEALEAAYTGPRTDAGRCAAIAENPSTPPATLARMVAEGAAWPDRVVANPNCPEEVLRAAATERPEHTVHRGLAANPRLPADLAMGLARRSTSSYDVGMQLAINPATPPEALALLASGEIASSASVRKAVLAHPACPREALGAVRPGQLERAELYLLVARHLTTASAAEAALGLVGCFEGSVAELLATAELLGGE